MSVRSVRNRLWTKVYNNCVTYGESSFEYKICSRLRDAKIKNTPYEKLPLVRTVMDDKKIIVPLSHNIPMYKKNYDNYDKAIAVLAKMVLHHEGKLNFVDVGANVGDTIINVGIFDEAKYLLVEGNPLFYNLIEENLNLNDENINYVLEKSFISDDEDNHFKINNRMSSASLTPTDVETEDTFKSLDRVIREYSFEPNIVKSDTDGFDFKVLRSGRETFEKYKPYIFFEWVPLWLERNHENPMSIWNYLNSLGYEKAIAFDNYGNPISLIDTNDGDNLRLFMNYTKNRNKRIYYFDFLLFNSSKQFDVNEYMKQFENY